MFDDWGETLSGITDSIVDGGQEFIDSWFDNEADKVRDAAPEEQRPARDPAIEPNGQPVYRGGNFAVTPTQLMLGALLIGGAVFLATKKG